jgi:hypothetical protein
MATPVEHGTALGCVQTHSLLLAQQFSANAAAGLTTALEGSLPLLAESCGSFNDADQQLACREIHDQCATLLALLREIAVSARPVKEEAAILLVRQFLVTIDRYRARLGINPPT